MLHATGRWTCFQYFISPSHRLIFIVVVVVNPESNFKSLRGCAGGCLREWERMGGEIAFLFSGPAATGCVASAGTEVTCPLRHSALCWPYGSMWASELTFTSFSCPRIAFHFYSSIFICVISACITAYICGPPVVNDFYQKKNYFD